MSASPVIPVVTSTKRTLLLLSIIYTPFCGFGFSGEAVGTLPAIVGAGDAEGGGGCFSTIDSSGTARTLVFVSVVIVAVELMPGRSAL
jgi:hypothetical protein